MDALIDPKERFRKGFVLLMTLTYAGLFFAMISGFILPLLLAAVFASIVYPLYTWLQGALGGRNTLAAVVALLVSLFAIVVPLIMLLGLVADQAIEVTNQMAPWVEEQLEASARGEQEIPGWVPYANELEPYREKISSKLAEIMGQAGGYLAAALGNMAQGTAEFFLNLFIMLYGMFVFFLSGPRIVATFLGFWPLSHDDKVKMLDVARSVSRATVKGTLVVGIVQGALGGLGFAVAGIDGAVFWAAIMAVLSILPGIGATLVWAPAVVYLLVTGETLVGLGLFAWCAGVVGTIDNVLRPMLVGRDTEMPDLLILLSTLGGLGLFGISGLVLGPTLAALFMAVLAIYTRVFADWLHQDDDEEPAT